MASAKNTMAVDALRRRDDAIRSHPIRDLEGELIDRREGYSAERDASQRDAVEYKRERDANARKASRLEEELEDMRREGKERDVEAGERDARICALESELADRREEIDMLEDARGRRAKLQMEMDGMTSGLDDLAGDVRMREEELAPLRGDVEFARTEKEEGHVEYEELGVRLVRGREELPTRGGEGGAQEDAGGGAVVRGTVRGGSGYSYASRVVRPLGPLSLGWTNHGASTILLKI